MMQIDGLERLAGSTRTGSAVCLEFNGRQRQVMTPNKYTELFFLDEAVHWPRVTVRASGAGGRKRRISYPRHRNLMKY